MRDESTALVPGAGPEANAKHYPIDLWNRADPRALINLVPTTVAEAILVASQVTPDLFNLDERTLKRRVSPTPTDNRLRLAFWMEYDRAQSNYKNMNMSAVYSGICARQYFEEKYIKEPTRAAWLVCPPTSYEVVMEEALSYGVERLREILELPFYNEQTGRVDSKTAELVLKTVALLDQRVKGAIVQKIEQKSLNVNLGSGPSKAVVNKELLSSMEEIEARLKYLEKKERQVLNLPEASMDGEEIEVEKVET